MQIINLNSNDQGNHFTGYALVDGHYYKFTVTEGKTTMKSADLSFQVDDYQHYAAVMGKFKPYTFFLEQPFEVRELTFQAMQQINRELLSG